MNFLFYSPKKKETFLLGASLAWLAVGALTAHMPAAWKIFEQAVEQRFYTTAEVTFARFLAEFFRKLKKKKKRTG